ncbi:MAG: RagB/SusD family nutrient uptake outer membrane protein [Ferruginibacter sp.]
MKKNIFKFLTFTLFASTVLYSGCDKTKLDLLPHGPTEASYFGTEADFNKAVLGVYAKMSDFYWYNGGSSHIGLFLLPGDDITTNSSNDESEVFASLQPSSGRVSYMYTSFYQLISRANVVIEKVDGVANGIYTTPNLKNSHKGEALFLRGFAYYYLWNYYGTAPLRTARPATSADFTPPGTAGTELLDQAIKDLSDAAALLPASWDAPNRGRVTANAANGLLGKALVFKASATKSAPDYTAAIEAFNKISGLSLVPNFGDNFSDAAENNNESLFEFQASKPFGTDNVWLNNDFDNAVGSISIFWGFYSNHWSLFGASPYFGTTKLLNAFNATDPRKALTLNADRTINKYVKMDNSTGGDPGSKDNYRILRLADVKLLKAEAVLQSGGSTTEAIGLINEVRTRARNMVASGTIPADFSTTETNKTTIMNWIMDERLMELAGEGQRWLDLRRWHMQGVITLNNSYFSSNVSVVFEAPKHLLLPIPNSELDVNPNVKQNAGY